MKSLWNDDEAANFSGDINQRVYTSRLLGREPALVLHGGGNTSVKIREMNLVGEDEDILYIKGSGWDLEKIEAAGFAPVRLDHLIKLAKLPQLSDAQMVNELRTQMTRASAPTPSVETILHATLPYKFVDHTHSDAIVAITNTASGHERIRELYGDTVVIVGYIMPGFDLARQCAEQFAREATPKTLGMVLLNHGIFSFGATARESYERMIELVTRAEEYLKSRKAWDISVRATPPDNFSPRDIATLRRDISTAAGKPMIVARTQNERTAGFISRPDIQRLSQQGPATPDHIIRTKRAPLLGRDVASYSAAYRAYFERHAPQAREPKTMLDPAPRVVLDRELGMLCVGNTAKDAHIVRDIYERTIDVIQQAEALGGWVALPEKDLFDMEYWDLEQAKLRSGSKAPMFTGEVALVTGAASGIGKACVESFLARGAAVIGCDINPEITTLYKRADFLGIVCDVTREDDIANVLRAGVAAFGGIDMAVLNAGVFPGGNRIESLSTADFKRVLDVNLNANLSWMRELHPYFKLAPRDGRLVVLGSKNVPAPGPGAAAYSASKAALTQLLRIAALEWGMDGIRVNAVHPDAVFDTSIWTPEVLEARAKHYGMTVEQYKRKNVLKTEVTRRDVAEMCAEMCGPLFAKTTAAQVPIDGGNDRVI